MTLGQSYLHPLLNGFILALLFWLCGLFLFVRDAGDFAAQPAPEKADGIVVLTGAKERVPTGLDLLVRGTAPLLLVSGIGEMRGDAGDMADRLVPLGHPARAFLPCCITLGTYAEDTPGNAIETRNWAEKHRLKRLIVVTSAYHMRRALIEMRARAPQLFFRGFAAPAPQVHLDGFWNWPGSASLLAEEYNKCLFALLRAGIRSIFPGT